ncbi:MAG: hypothetical protein SWJ54_12790 [Cyanobacteriota bacterium]|nr:hypothetical protein [Cyanobacteriota bacterium]
MYNSLLGDPLKAPNAQEIESAIRFPIVREKSLVADIEVFFLRSQQLQPTPSDR